MTEKFSIVGYCRISVDDELDRDNTSIENQKSIISDYVKRSFPGSELTFYEDRDRSGYTFEQREGYQSMRPLLMGRKYDILIVKDFSRFSRRNSRGLVELEDLRDAGVRIISIGDSIDYPTYDDWTAIQFRFLVNEMPVTDASKKVRSVIKRRQEDGRWICAVPYGYVITNSKTMTFEIETAAAEVVRKIFELYNAGWGYKRIANYLTDEHIPTPRMDERARKEAKGEECNIRVRSEWSIATVQGILQNDFYIGTLRQGKYTRKKINGDDVRRDVDDHIVFEHHHEAIIDYRTFAIAQEGLKKRTTSSYRGIKKNDNVYSGFLVCGDCGSPMFAMSRSDLRDAYRCGRYHRMGVKACTSHHIRVDVLDSTIRDYLRQVRDTSAVMIARLEESIRSESEALDNSQQTVDMLERQLADAREELKILTRQKAREIMRNPDAEETIEETYDELLAECQGRIDGLQNQIAMTFDKRNTIIRVNRIAATAISIFDEILEKGKLDKQDLGLLIDCIFVYEDHIEIRLKSDIDAILRLGTLPQEDAANFNQGIVDSLKSVIVQTSEKRPDKVYDVNIVSNGDPLEIYTDNDGEVIFKKYSPIGELSPYSGQYAEVLCKNSGFPSLICDRDHVVAAAGVSRKEYLDRRISHEMEEMMEGRRSFISKSASDGSMQPVEGLDRRAVAMFPVLASGDIVGSVVLLESDSGNFPKDTEIKLAQVAAGFLGKQMEE